MALAQLRTRCLIAPPVALTCAGELWLQATQQWIQPPRREDASTSSLYAITPRQLHNLSLTSLPPSHQPAAAQLTSLRHLAATPRPWSSDGINAPPISHPSSAVASNTAGWSQKEVLNAPNALSMARLLSGPLLATWIVQERWELALPVLAVSAATDWLDGWLARRAGLRSVLGSYLDPLADKVLVGSVVGALGYTGALPGPLVGVVLGRDAFLVAGAFYVRADMLNWRWPGIQEFFRIVPANSNAASGMTSPGPGEQAPADRGASVQEGQSATAPFSAAMSHTQNGDLSGSFKCGVQPTPVAPVVHPLFVSKVNTALQLALVGACMADAWVGWPGAEAVWGLGAATAGTTLWTCAAYARAYMSGELLSAAREPA